MLITNKNSKHKKTNIVSIVTISIIALTMLICGAMLLYKNTKIGNNEENVRADASLKTTENVGGKRSDPSLLPATKIEKKVFGVSANDRPIEGYVMGSGENTIFLLSAIHGDEKNTAELLNEFVREVQSNQELIHESKKIVVIPIANPDGYFERTDNLNTNGVNLNRNFETNTWDQYDPNGSFAGTKPFSEAESKVIQQVVEEYEPYMMIAFHAQGGVIAPEEDSASIALANWYGEKTGYTYYGEWQYTGTATGWFLETTQKPSITVELSNHEESDWQINREALLALVSSEHISFK